MFELVESALTQMIKLIEDTEGTVLAVQSLNIENEINTFRSRLKENNIFDINDKKYDYQMGVHYMDIICDCEKLGDYVINVVEAHAQVRLTV